MHKTSCFNQYIIFSRVYDRFKIKKIIKKKEANLKSTLEQLLLLKSSKRRVTEVNNSYFECKTVNFDSKELMKRLEEIDQEIQKTDFEISKLNSIEFEI